MAKSAKEIKQQVASDKATQNFPKKRSKKRKKQIRS
jgi:hypothetical protein